LAAKKNAFFGHFFVPFVHFVPFYGYILLRNLRNLRQKNQPKAHIPNDKIQKK